MVQQQGWVQSAAEPQGVPSLALGVTLNVLEVPCAKAVVLLLPNGGQELR